MKKHYERLLSRRFDFLEQLGEGVSGTTYFAREVSTGKEVAIKVIPTTSFGIEDLNDEIQANLDLSPKMGNGYTPKFYESTIIPDPYGKNPIYGFIISEYIEGNTMETILEDLAQGKVFSPHNLWSYMLQLILGLKYIHNNGYAHGDIKPDNILLSSKDSRIKYIDFGVSCVAECKYDLCNNICNGLRASLAYTSPENLKETMESSLTASQAQDCWSLAILLFQFCNYSKYPYDHKSSSVEEDILRVKQEIISAPKYKSNYTQDDGRTNIFLDTILINDVNTRPNIQQILDIFLELVMSTPY